MPSAARRPIPSAVPVVDHADVVVDAVRTQFSPHARGGEVRHGDGIPVAYWGDPLDLTTQGCAGAVATYQVVIHGHVVRTGSLSKVSPGTYRTTIDPLMPNSGDGEIDIDLDCPSGPDEKVDFGIYIDPSGQVRDTNGKPVEGAT